ncbi:MAG: PAS domain S-box protein [Verrucomicrobia bacterium]|nr:PAS domain S-box protein [Verrucomicrobiota bacterium]MDE3100034.1 PAS domain S-box protein [Verrucomicrobiota bacterium]
MPPKSSFLDKVLGRINRLDAEGLQTVVQRLAQERNFLETLFNTIEDGVLVVDDNGRIIYFNQAVTRLIGLQPGAGETDIAKILPEADWEKVRGSAPGDQRRLVWHEFEVHYPRPRFLRLYAAPLAGEATGVSGMALILHDATEARQQTVEAVESERLQALTLLAAGVAHELGNPLNALHIHLQLMERELKKLRRANAAEICRRLEEYLGVAKGEISRLDYIITQFLGAIRPAPLQLKLATLNDVLHTTLDLLRPEIENRGLAIQTKPARHLTATLMDTAQMQQVLVNLIKNAMHAMTGGGTLTVQTGESADGVWVSVADTGGGIPQEQINRIFEPFFTTKKKGTGLGLLIVQRVVRAHNGRIELESRVGRGTTFRIWLPLHERRPRLLEGPKPRPKAPEQRTA